VSISADVCKLIVTLLEVCWRCSEAPRTAGFGQIPELDPDVG